ncbi:MAG: PEP-CTERM sorting domain-containing protein [Pirellulales bacterium]|nr:PEP-CTERM sorting domain-containing protein [Pirellulales bacterium]
MKSRLHAVGVRAGITTLCLALVAGLCGTSQYAQGGNFTLIDDNSSASIDTASQSGMYDWFVDGTDQMFQQWFWYRIGGTPEASVDTLPIAAEGTSDVNFNGDPDALFVRYAGAGFEIELRYLLDGGNAGSGASDMSEQIVIRNNSDGPLDFHFFQYSDFDLNNSPGGDTGVFTNLNTVFQQEGNIVAAETVVTPVASHREIADYPSLLGALNDGAATTLSDTPAIGVTVGPSDITWAYQWDVVIPVGGAFQISKDKHIYAIPEPSTMIMAGLAGLGLLMARLRRGRRA